MHWGDDKKVSEVICVASSGPKVVITYAIINQEVWRVYFSPLVLMKNKVASVLWEPAEGSNKHSADFHLEAEAQCDTVLRLKKSKTSKDLQPPQHQ